MQLYKLHSNTACSTIWWFHVAMYYFIAFHFNMKYFVCLRVFQLSLFYLQLNQPPLLLKNIAAAIVMIRLVDWRECDWTPLPTGFQIRDNSLCRTGWNTGHFYRELFFPDMFLRKYKTMKRFPNLLWYWRLPAGKQTL